MGKTGFSDKLTELFKKAQDSPGMNEETLRIKFAQSDVLSELRYTDENIYWEEGLENQKRTDITCKDDIGDFNVVFEFKKPSEDNLASHKSQLKNRYVVPYKAKYGVLYNGLKLIFYERQGNELNEVFRSSTNELEGNYLDGMFRRIKKPDRATTNLDEVVDYMEEYQDPEERLSLENQIAREYFYENFQLEEDSVFGNFVVNTVKLFNDRRDKSKFLRSAYQFWKRSYAKELNKSQIPDEWEPLFDKAGLSTGTKEDRLIFTFCLETAYATFTRLILTKSAEDYGFPGDGFSTILRRQLEDSAWDGGVPQSGYANMSLKIIREMQGKLISSVFEEDIFYWWTEPYDDVDSYIDYFRGEADVSEEMSQFGKSLAEILLTVYKYEFSNIGEEDILGVLYQKYFDRETRKALGEFYTPKEVVNYILDSVGYEGKEVLNKRVLDPACGSGTFLVEALDRYLKQAEKSGKADEVGWRSVLQDLCNEYHVIGFDVHPFATIMAQIQFTLKIMPYYRRALEEDDSYFVLQRLPIFRTDSLNKEQDIGNLTLEESTRGQVISMPIELPIQGEGEDDFFEKDFKLPLYKAIRDNTGISNTQEYFGALQALFDAVKQRASDLGPDEEPEIDVEDLATILRRADYVRDKNWDALASFLKPDADLLLERIQELKHEFDDGRLIKSIEDVMLAAILKNEMEYEYVVGNPPYVPIQEIPDKQKNKWKDAYRYTEGNYDIYIPFMERGIDWLKPNGKVSYIVSNRFLLTQYAEKMRENLPEEVTIDKMVDMRDSRVFEDALNYPAVFVFSKRDHPQEYFPAIRIFEDPEEPEQALQDMEEQVSQVQELEDYSKGEYSDAFNVKYDDLEPEGWHLMPQKERKIMDIADDAGDGRLFDFTRSRSGGFQGVSTSEDDLYVLDFIEESGNEIRVRPKGGGEPFNIEKGLVRPFLFGKDVERWNIEWKGWYVIFPYREYNGEYQIIPSKEYEGDYEHEEEYMEAKYPKGWQYLKEHEEDLRDRAGGKFEEGANQERRWYGMGYPRSKDKYDKEKVLAQLNSQEADYVFDREGEYVFQGGGKGGGVYGILPDQNLSSVYLTGLLNSDILDYYLKHISTVYAGKSYSYADAYIKQLPMITQSIDEDVKSKIKSKAKTLAQRERLKQRIRLFPKPHFSGLKEEGVIDEWDEVKHTTVGGYYPLNIRRQKDLKGNSEIKLGKDDWISSHKIDSEVKQEYVIKAIDGKRFSKEEQIVIPIPRTDEAAEKALQMLEEDKEELETGKTKKELEEELNNSVHSIYGIEDQEKEVVDDFLDRF